MASSDFSGNLDARIELGFLLGEVSRLLRAAFDREMASIGLTRSKWHALVYVLRLEGPSQAELADALEIARPTVGALVDQLESLGYVERQRDLQDRRVWRVVPTELARQRAEQLAEAAERVASDAFRSIAPEDLAAAIALLSRVRENLKSPDAVE
jgi:DNA-binding MarR family transcriptional regulator